MLVIYKTIKKSLFHNFSWLDLYIVCKRFICHIFHIKCLIYMTDWWGELSREAPLLWIWEKLSISKPNKKQRNENYDISWNLKYQVEPSTSPSIPWYALLFVVRFLGHSTKVWPFKSIRYQYQLPVHIQDYSDNMIPVLVKHQCSIYLRQGIRCCAVTSQNISAQLQVTIVTFTSQYCTGEITSFLSFGQPNLSWWYESSFCKNAS